MRQPTEESFPASIKTEIYVMKTVTHVVPALALCILLTASVTTRAADVPGVPAPQPTIWSFLGIPQGMHKIHDGLFNRKGKHPGLERKDALLRIADPANLVSEIPAIKAAAEIKADADLAPQKIKAIKYLAEVGCACSSQKADVQAALLAALDDCTEDVRYEAAVAICKTAASPCSNCGSTCCGDDIVKKLTDMAFGQDDNGCWKEASARVRAAAQSALNACPGLTPIPEVPEGGERAPEAAPVSMHSNSAAMMPMATPTLPPRPSLREMPAIPPTKLAPSTSRTPSEAVGTPMAVRPAGFTWSVIQVEKASADGLHWPKQNDPSAAGQRFREAFVPAVR